MWVLGKVQGPNITLFSGSGDVKQENKGDFQAAITYMLANGWEPFSAGDQNMVVVWFRKRVS